MSEETTEKKQQPTPASTEMDNSIKSMSLLVNTADRILRRDLRWRNIRAMLIAVSLVAGPLIYSVGLKALVTPQSINEAYAALVRIEGTIDADQKANAHKINQALRAAFEDQKSKGVILLVNSPGGSPVQSSLIYERIKQLRAEYPKTKLWAIGEDYMTSGAYFISVASDNICVNRSTLTGSVGVIMSGWGLNKVLERFDVERRVFTAGSNKDRMDTFKPMSEEDRKKAAGLLSSMHQHFIDAVESGRKERLKGTREQLFSGDYWTGDEAVRLGLADSLCDLSTVMANEMQVKQIKDYTVPPSIFQSLSSSFGVAIQNLILSETQSDQPMLLP